MAREIIHDHKHSIFEKSFTTFRIIYSDFYNFPGKQLFPFLDTFLLRIPHSKTFLHIKSLIVSGFSKVSLHVMTNLVLHINKKIVCLPPNKEQIIPRIPFSEVKIKTLIKKTLRRYHLKHLSPGG